MLVEFHRKRNERNLKQPAPCELFIIQQFTHSTSTLIIYLFYLYAYLEFDFFFFR